MKFILIALMQFPNQPVITSVTAEFDDQVACEVAKTAVLTNAQTLNGRIAVLQQCLPKSSEAAGKK